ncbi:MAG: bifunctional diaminohydroxyphosphoribosylaminopyrimidine deaminase/5-amino-6-(5-phosphoribosylamino)uracil reductase RibD [Bacteroidaceae bacterium]|nr:bifunctional diaminohydroxyphosphoribosylaminopyrimidine deaminase/5-amino-6-(5-phosphoribosylamino)uracil reductase RibD [Bacteroidaceae bacterium]
MTSHDNWQGSSNATDELYMQRCIELARHGMAAAPPNPMVGAVIVHQGRIIGEGWHRRCGGPHAEVNAIASVAPTDAHLLPEATIYVSLEPCSHWGRTPPCADLIVEKGLRRVVVGCQDPFAKVSGRGIERLRQAGIDVTVGVLQEECLRLNRRFITFHTRQRPWITLKWAQSADAYIDRRRTSRADGSPVHFSSAWTQTLVHRLRAHHQAIVVGRRTWELDAPALTTRLWPGPSPMPCVLSKTMAPSTDTRPAVYASIAQLLADLHRQGRQALLVEGGAATLQAFIDADLWDEAYVEKSDIVLGSGVPAPRLPADTKGRQLHVNFA